MTVIQSAAITSPFVLDASVIINLLGGGHAHDVLTAMSSSFIVEERTLREIRRHPIPGRSHIEELAALKTSGLLQTYRMSDEAYELYLELIDGNSSDCLGDGESAAIATAATLGYGLVLDDRKARRVHAERFPKIPFISSLRLLVSANEQDTGVAAKLPDIIESAIRYSRMAILKEERHLVERLVA